MGQLDFDCTAPTPDATTGADVGRVNLKYPGVVWYKLNLKANFETSLSLDRLEG
jgi:hypothetical protein